MKVTMLENRKYERDGSILFITRDVCGGVYTITRHSHIGSAVVSSGRYHVGKSSGTSDMARAHRIAIESGYNQVA